MPIPSDFKKAPEAILVDLINADNGTSLKPGDLEFGFPTAKTVVNPLTDKNTQITAHALRSSGRSGNVTYSYDRVSLSDIQLTQSNVFYIPQSIQYVHEIIDLINQRFGVNLTRKDYRDEKFPSSFTLSYALTLHAGVDSLVFCGSINLQLYRSISLASAITTTHMGDMPLASASASMTHGEKITALIAAQNPGSGHPITTSNVTLSGYVANANADGESRMTVTAVDGLQFYGTVNVYYQKYTLNNLPDLEFEFDQPPSNQQFIDRFNELTGSSMKLSDVQTFSIPAVESGVIGQVTLQGRTSSFIFRGSKTFNFVTGMPTIAPTLHTYVHVTLPSYFPPEYYEQPAFTAFNNLQGATATFTGTATAGATVEVMVGSTTVATTAAGDGTWSATFTLTAGTYSVKARQSVEEGIKASDWTALQSFTIDTTPPNFAAQAGSFAEGTLPGVPLVTVVAEDNLIVVDFRFVDSDSHVSADGHYQVNSAGEISLTQAGYEANLSGSTDYSVANCLLKAKDSAGNWSTATTVTITKRQVNLYNTYFKAPTVYGGPINNFDRMGKTLNGLVIIDTPNWNGSQYYAKSFFSTDGEVWYRRGDVTGLDSDSRFMNYAVATSGPYAGRIIAISATSSTVAAYSDDEGVTWVPITFGSSKLRYVTWNDYHQKFIAVQNSGAACEVSVDGLTWVTKTLDTTGAPYWWSVVSNGARVIVLGRQATGGLNNTVVAYSDDSGENWTYQVLPSLARIFRGISAKGSTLVAYTNDVYDQAWSMFSTDNGATWVSGNYLAEGEYTGSNHGGSHGSNSDTFAVMHKSTADGKMQYVNFSTNGLNWNKVYIGSYSSLEYASFGRLIFLTDRFVIGAGSKIIVMKTNPATAANADVTAPVATGQTIAVTSGVAAGTALGTVVATDNVGVTSFVFADSDKSVSADGYVQINAGGQLSYTAAGVAAGANRFQLPLTYRWYDWDQPQFPTTSSVVVGNDAAKFIFIDNTNLKVYHSTDGKVLTQVGDMPAHNGNGWSKPWWNGTLYLCFERYGTKVAYSSDAISWTAVDSLSAVGSAPKAAWSSTAGVWVTLNDRGSNTNTLKYSADGLSWTNFTIASRQWQDVIWSPVASKFLALATGSIWYATSNTPASWSWGSVTGLDVTVTNWQAIASNGSIIVAVSLTANKAIATSTNGTAFTMRDVVGSATFYTVTYDSTTKKFVALGSGVWATSSDGLAWDVRYETGVGVNTYLDPAAAGGRVVLWYDTTNKCTRLMDTKAITWRYKVQAKDAMGNYSNVAYVELVPGMTYDSTYGFTTSGGGGGTSILNSGRQWSWYNTSGAGSARTVQTSVPIKDRKYMEFKMTVRDANPPVGFGITNGSAAVFYTPGAYTVYAGNGGCGLPASGLRANGSDSGNLPAYNFVVGDVVGVAVDAVEGKIWISINGKWISGDPALGTSPSMTFTPGTWYFFASCYTCNTNGNMLTVELYPNASLGTYPAPATFTYYQDDSATVEATTVGLTKLVTGYAGSAIRVRRASDDSEADIGFSGTALDVAALRTFIGSSSAYVKIMYDQTGNGRHFQQTVKTAQPQIAVNGIYLGRLYFDGVDDILVCVKDTDLSVNHFTVFLDGHNRLASTNTQTLISTSGGAKVQDMRDAALAYLYKSNITNGAVSQTMAAQWSYDNYVNIAQIGRSGGGGSMDVAEYLRQIISGQYMDNLTELATSGTAVSDGFLPTRWQIGGEAGANYARMGLKSFRVYEGRMTQTNIVTTATNTGMVVSRGLANDVGETPAFSYLANVFGVYGLRKLVPSYAGPCLRLFRSDGAETDIGFTAAGVIDKAAMMTYLFNFTGYVKTWYDQSGNGNHLTMSYSTAFYPRIAYAGMMDLGVYFYGAHALKSANTLGAGVNKLTVYTRAYCSDYNNKVLLELTADSGAGDGLMLLAGNVTGKVSGRITNTSTNKSQNDYTSGLVWNNSCAVFDRSQASADNQVKFYSGGLELTKTSSAHSGSVPSGNFANDYFYLGSRNASGSALYPFVGYVASLVIYKDAHDATTVDVISKLLG